MGKKRQVVKTQTALIGLVLILSILGLLFVFDASVGEAFTTFNDQYHFVKQHGIRLIVGLISMITVSFLPLEFWRRTGRWWYPLSLVLLISVFIPGLGQTFNGARRWINLGGIVIQPIEIVKLSLIVFFASWMSQHQRLLPFLFTAGLPLILVIFQPDLGSLLVLTAISFGMFYLAGSKITHLVGVGLVGLLLLTLAVTTSSYRWQRVKTFLNPSSDPLGAGFHIRQITLALGRGGWFGQGIGNSRQKYNYIPEASSDSIFAIIAEEVGFIWSTLLIGLFGLLFFNLARAANQAEPQSFPYLLGWGILIWIGVQALLNLSAVVALVPLTGIPLPFFSYGGTSLVMILTAIGLILRIGKEYN